MSTLAQIDQTRLSIVNCSLVIDDGSTRNFITAQKSLLGNSEINRKYKYTGILGERSPFTSASDGVKTFYYETETLVKTELH